MRVDGFNQTSVSGVCGAGDAVSLVRNATSAIGVMAAANAHTALMQYYQGRRNNSQDQGCGWIVWGDRAESELFR